MKKTVFMLLILAMASHIDTLPSQAQDKGISAWANNVYNDSVIDIYISKAKNPYGKANLIEAHSKENTGLSEPPDGITYIRNSNKETLYSIVQHGEEPYTLSSVIWKSGKPYKTLECYSIIKNKHNEYGYDLRYKNSGYLQFERIDLVTATLIAPTDERCTANFQRLLVTK